MTALERLGKARSRLIIDHPFFGSLALRLKLAEDVENRRNPYGTLCTDGSTLWYGRKWVESQDTRVLMAAVAHEVMHLAMRHLWRRKDRIALVFNFAGDFSINPILKDAGFPLGEGWLYSETFKRPDGTWMAAEEIYPLLFKDGPCDCGSGDKGHGGQDHEGCGGMLSPVDADGNDASSGANASAMQADWEAATHQAAAAAKAAGKLPSGIERWIAAGRSVVPWQDVLREFIVHELPMDYSWSRPNPRHLPWGMFSPGRQHENSASVACVIDTSGSIDDGLLASFLGEIRAIISDVRPSATVVMACDAAVHGVESFGPDEPLTFRPSGGGGTSFAPPFEEVDKLGLTPACLIYLTDLYGYFPEDEPPYPVLWAVWPGGGQEAPFGRVLQVRA